MKVERNTAVRSTATARRSGASSVAVSSPQVAGQAVVSVSNQGGIAVPDLSSLNPTPPQFILPSQLSYPTSSAGSVAQLTPMQQTQGQQILLNNMNEQQLSPARSKLIRRGHQLELLTEAKILCDRQDFVDLTIYCEDGVVRAHQMLLAVASPFLMLLFQSNPSYGNDDITLILPEVKACLVQALIHFVYTGVVVSNENHFYSLMKLVYALNINASIEAESTNERATTFTAPLVAPSCLSQALRLPHQQSAQQYGQPGLGQQQTLSTLPQQLLPQQPVPLHQSINGSPSNSSNVNSLAAAAVAAITQPAIVPPNLMPPPSKAPRLSGPPANAVPVPIQNLQGQTVNTSSAGKIPIQLPTQPVPLVNGVVRGTESSNQQIISSISAPTQQYIAIDPATGINYKVDMSLTGGGDDPLAAIMNETIFQDSTTGAIVPAPNAQIYQTDNGQVIYTTQPPPNATATIPTNIQIQQPQPLTSTPVQSGKRGKKRGAVKQENSPLNNNGSLVNNTAPSSVLSSVQIAGDQGVEDLPCTPDDEDINTPYPCPSCNKTIKGKVMLQAHHFQEHYDNPELNQVDIGDKHACRVCLKLFTRNSDVKAHILRVHCGDRRYPCTMCGKRFKESTHLRKHLYTHTGERPHYCTLCSKGFQTSSDLKRHKRTRVHQERVEQGGGIEPESTAPPPEASVAKKSAPVVVTGPTGDTSATTVTSSIANTSVASADGSLAGAATRWSDEDEMNESGSTTANTSASAAQVLLSGITEPVAMDTSDTGNQLIVPTTNSPVGDTITQTTTASSNAANDALAASSIVQEGTVVTAAEMLATTTTVVTNWTGSGGGIITSNAPSGAAADGGPALDLKELTSASDMSAFIESAAENIASGNGISTTTPGGRSSEASLNPMAITGAPDAGAEIKVEHQDNGLGQVQGIDELMPGVSAGGPTAPSSKVESQQLATNSDSVFQEASGSNPAQHDGSAMGSINLMKQSSAAVAGSGALDSPGQDEGEQRLTVVETPDDSSQGSEHSNAPVTADAGASSSS